MPADDRPLALTLVDGRRKLDDLVKAALARRPDSNICRAASVV